MLTSVLRSHGNYWKLPSCRCHGDCGAFQSSTFSWRYSVKSQKKKEKKPVLGGFNRKRFPPYKMHSFQHERADERKSFEIFRIILLNELESAQAAIWKNDDEKNIANGNWKKKKINRIQWKLKTCLLQKKKVDLHSQSSRHNLTFKK